MARDKTRMKRKERKNIATGVAHVNSSFNNTKILISDVQGNAISWSSAGTMGFKGSRKSTPYAAQMAAEDAGRKAQEHGMRTIEVEVQGPGSGRESALRALAAPVAGASVVHCAAGKDRTGLVIGTVLAALGVDTEAIAADYRISTDALRPFFARMDFPDQAHLIDAALARHGFTIESAVEEQLDGFDAWATLRDAGLTDAELATLRGRLVA